MRLFSIAIASIAVLQIALNFPIGKLLSFALSDESSRYFSALIFFITCSILYILSSLYLIIRRIQGAEATFSLPYRGEILLHLVSLTFISGALAFSINYGRASADVGTLRVFEYFSYFGTGIIAITWTNFLIIIVHGPKDVQRNLDIELRGRTFMEAPDWLEDNKHDNT